MYLVLPRKALNITSQACTPVETQHHMYSAQQLSAMITLYGKGVVATGVCNWVETGVDGSVKNKMGMGIATGACIVTWSKREWDTMSPLLPHGPPCDPPPSWSTM